MKKIITAALAMAILFSSCKKDPIDNNNSFVPVSVEFDNIVGGQNLILNAANYTNAAGESFNVSQLKYFVSNFKFRKSDGSEYVVNQDSSYFLIDEEIPASRFARFKLPTGDYTQVSFVVGVDSLRSTMDISKRTGVLDPSASHDGMYWGWNSGYIFFKMEGISAAAPVDASGQRKFRYHIGGFGGYSSPTINNIRTITLDLQSSGIAQVREGRNSNVHIMADVLKMFNGSTTVSIAANPMVMFSEYSVNISNNYSGMFVHDHTEN